MIKLFFAKLYSFIYGFIHDKFHYNIRGLGFLLRRIEKHVLLDIPGEKVMLLHHDVSTSYPRLINGNWAEPETHLFLQRILDLVNRAIFVDVGASIGEMVVDVAGFRNVEHVFAFEPTQINADVIRINSLINNQTNVSVCNMALSNNVGTVWMEPNGTPQSQVSEVITATHSVAMKTTTLDEYYEKNIKNIISLDTSMIILIDVEGY